MTKPTTSECISWLDAQIPILDIRTSHTDFAVSIRAQLIAAQQMAKDAEETCKLMLKITDESVPLFSSDRLHNLHKQCREHLEKILKTRSLWHEAGGE